ncbi:hypothetical protein E0H75_36190 [Kribbella capetownensis]|uniref:Uncharacterized protein n=1 Tax=Kribbella capetownensis TaxID=1572659 RepID=A0A4R0JQJ6_9ACTN|nr:hypothetical protein [Kribbella capetownensis]TCC44285.1 hypothetical protein E0H75_36190 [Kribbella capetownensis]
MNRKGFVRALAGVQVVVTGLLNPLSAGDGDPNDYGGAIWVIVAVAVVAVIVGAGTFYLVRSRRIDLSQGSTPEGKDDSANTHRDG